MPQGDLETVKRSRGAQHGTPRDDRSQQSVVKFILVIQRIWAMDQSWMSG